MGENNVLVIAGHDFTECFFCRFDIADKRVHACLYFIAPTGHGLKPLDVEVMKKIHKKVNIIPVIGKADSCTMKEVNMFKTKVNPCFIFSFKYRPTVPCWHCDPGWSHARNG